MKIIEQVPGYIRNLVPYAPGKPIEEVEREFGIPNSIKLASNENPLGPSPFAVEAMRQKLNDLHLYPDGDCFYLKSGLSRELKVSAEQLICGNGSNEIIELAIRTFMRPDDEAVMARQAFVVYKLVVQAVGGVSKEVPLRDFAHDLDAMAKAITARTRIVFLANPNNPTGTIFRKAQWESFLERVPSKVMIIVDEAYFEYVEAPDYPDSLIYHNQGKTLLTLRTFSKLYGLAGLRIGYGVGSREIIDLMQRVRQPFNVNAPAQWGALAALGDRQHVRRSLENNRQGLEYLTRELAASGIEYVPTYANFVLIRVGRGEEVFNRLLARGIIVRPMTGYQFPEYIRVTIGTMEENQKFIDALRKVIGS